MINSDNIKLPFQALSPHDMPQSKDSLFSLILLVSFLLIPFFGVQELHFALSMAALLLLSIFSAWHVGRAFSLIYPSMFVCAFSFFVTIYHISSPDFSIFSAAKGFWYSSRPFLYFILGSLVCVSMSNRFVIFRCIAAAATLTALCYIYTYFDKTAGTEVSREFIRGQIGTGTLLWPLAISLILFYHRWIVSSRSISPFIANVLSYFALAAIMSALYLSTGRTGLILIFFVIIAKYRIAPVSNASIGSVILAIFLFLLFASTPLIPLLGFPIDLSWVSNLPMLEETAPTDQKSLSDINEHWRGFESYLAFSYVFNYSPLAIISGLGLSLNVPLGFRFVLAGEVTQELPVFHNGLSFLIVRAGLVGIFLHVLQYMILARFFGKQALFSEENGRVYRLGLGLTLYSAMSTSLVGGFYNTSEGGSILPFLLGYLAFFGVKRFVYAQPASQGLRFRDF